MVGDSLLLASIVGAALLLSTVGESGAIIDFENILRSYTMGATYLA